MSVEFMFYIMFYDFYVSVCRLGVEVYLLSSINTFVFVKHNHTSWVAVVAPTDRPKAVRNRCVIELFCCVVCVVTLPF